MSVGALILAAGRGSRFGESPKLLAEHDGLPLVGHVARAALRSRARPVLAVLGHRREAVAAALEGLDIVPVDNPAYADGLSTSLKAGFAALPPDVDAVVVLLGDMPLVTADLIDALVRTWEDQGRPGAVIPVHAGRRGNPVLLSRTLQADIAALSGDRGAGPILARRVDIAEMDWADETILADVDTPQALAALKG